LSASVNNQSMVKYWEKQRQSTVTEALATGSPRFARSALSPADRPYYNAFVKLTDQDEREKALALVSPEMGGLLNLSWNATKDTSKPKNLSLANDLVSMDPKHNFAAMSPDVPLDLAAVKIAKDEGLNYHELGMRRQQEIEADLVFDDWKPLNIGPSSRQGQMSAHLHRMLQQLGLSNQQIQINMRPAFHNSARVDYAQNRSYAPEINRYLGYTLDGFGSRF